MKRIYLALLSPLFVVATLTSCRKSTADVYDMRQEAEQIISQIATTAFPSTGIVVLCPDSTSSVDARTLIQHAIDSCSTSGGGRVVIGSGTYHIRGPIVMKSDVNLHLAKGAYMQFSGHADDFLPEVYTRWEGTETFAHSPMIYALHAVNIAITGEGTIDAQGGIEFAPYSDIEVDYRERLREMGNQAPPLYERRPFSASEVFRPECIQLIGCSRILIEDVTIRNSPFWTIHPVYCDNLIVRRVTIDSHFPNNDGCDPESTSNVLIEHCTFRTGDDAVAIKSGRDTDGRRVGRSSKNIVIRHCLFHSECNGLCIGSEMSGGAENVYMHDIEIEHVKNAIYFKSNRDRGGYIRNVRVSDIEVGHTDGAILRFETNYQGYRGGTFPSLYEDFRIRNVRARESDNYAIFMDGLPEMPMRDITIENFTVENAPMPYHLYATEGVVMHNVVINGETLTETPDNDAEPIQFAVY